MKKAFIAILVNLSCASAFAASGSGNVSNVVNLGGINQSNATTFSIADIISVPNGGLISGIYKTIMSRSVTFSGGPNYYGLGDMTNATGNPYQVAGGKAFNGYRVCGYGTSDTGFVSGNYVLGQSTGVPVLAGSTSAPTGFQPLGGTTSSTFAVSGAGTSSSFGYTCFDIPYAVPASDYPVVFVAGGSTLTGAIILLFGIEQ